MKKLSEFKCPPAKKKTGEKYCRLCEKREKRGTCGYGGKMWAVSYTHLTLPTKA